MKRISRRLPSPALVIACLALFVALGGTVLAATKIDGRRIEVRSLPGNRLEVGSLPGNRIATDSVKGSQIQLDTLGEVPSAAHADSADTARRAQTATAADHAADATTINGHTVGCPAGRRQYAGACWDLTPSAAVANATDAAASCAAQGGELPSLLTFMAFLREPGANVAVGGEWVDEIIALTTDYDVLTLQSNGSVFASSPQSLFHYRCVTPLLG
ncbi:MAG: hypothetical protein JST59_23675 [Actinobacteria bacterium]|nr:hypothetical protein [Actinomycetota bacterium]